MDNSRESSGGVSKQLFLEQIARLGAYLGIGELSEYFLELEKSTELYSDIEDAVSDVDFFRKKEWSCPAELGIYRVVNYVLARIYKPAVFIETGVLHGLSSLVILAALKRNGEGLLVSIDEPSYFERGPANEDGFIDTLPPGKEPGWVVSSKYRANWKLLIGKTSDMLPGCLKDYEGIDIFLHDSDHTYRNMWMEFMHAWEGLRKGGVLVCDNICCNTSFFDFCWKVERFPIVFPEIGAGDNGQDNVRFGLIKK